MSTIGALGEWASRLFESNTAPTRSLDDAALLAHASRGSEPAARELLERYGQRLYAIIEAAHGDLSLSEDVVQETFIRAIQQGHQLRRGASLFPWLARIALRVAVDFRRKLKRETLTDVLMEVPDRALSADRKLEHLEDQARVKEALQKLKANHRELLVLRYFASLSMAELAQVFSKSEVAIRKDLQRARARLRDELEDWFEEAKR